MVIRRYAAATVMGAFALGTVGSAVHAAVFQQYAPSATDTGAVAPAARVSPQPADTEAAPAREVVGDKLPSTLRDGITGDFTVDQYTSMASQGDDATLSLARDTSRFVLLQPTATGSASVSARSFDVATSDAEEDAVNAPVVPTSPPSKTLTLSQMGIVTWQPAPRTSVAKLDPASLPAVSLNADGFALTGLPLPAAAGNAAAIKTDGSFDSGSVASGRGPSAEFRLSNNVLRQAASAASGADESVAMRAIRSASPDAVPEPASLGLLGLAGLGLLARRRRAN